MKKTNESGRSMVEMLGVLAIIGVLSIGGIAGYSMAMNRYRANEALDAATKYAVILYAGKQTAQATGATSYTPVSFADALGSTTNPGGATITTPQESAITDTGVELEIDFGDSTNVCKAAVSILGTTDSCEGGSLTYTFKQS